MGLLRGYCTAKEVGVLLPCLDVSYNPTTDTNEPLESRIKWAVIRWEAGRDGDGSLIGLLVVAGTKD